MTRVIKKSRLLLEGKYLLGSLVFLEDNQGRKHLKLSFKNKISPGRLWHEDKTTGKRTEITQHEEKTSIDVSYKFNDSALEIKRQVPGQKPEAKFLKVPLPIENYLLIVRVKNWHHLNQVVPDNDSLLLSAPSGTDKLAIIFSFVGAEGQPFKPDEYADDRDGNISVFTFPHSPPLDKIVIGITQDSENEEPYNLTIKIPQYAEQAPESE